MAGPLLTPTNAINGGTFDATLLANTTTYFDVLYDGLSSYNGSTYPPVYVQGTSASTNAAHNTTTTMTISTITFGSMYVTSGAVNTTSAGSISYLTGRRVFVYFASSFGANITGFRRQNIVISNSGNTTDYSTYTGTKTPAATGATTINQLVLIPFYDTASPSTFNISFNVWQNSGSTLAVTSYFKIFQVPTYFS